MVDKMGMGILASTKRRLKVISTVTAFFGFVTFLASLTIYDWASRFDSVKISYVNTTGFNCEFDMFNCHEKKTWMEASVLAVFASIYQFISSVFLFRSALGMRSWIVGNLIMATFSICFSAFILNAFPNLMGVFLVNFIILALCSTMGYFVKNMVAFEESSMTLL